MKQLLKGVADDATRSSAGIVVEWEEPGATTLMEELAVGNRLLAQLNHSHASADRCGHHGFKIVVTQRGTDQQIKLLVSQSFE